MNDNGFANDVQVRAGVHLPEVCRQRDVARAVLADRDIADVSKMERIASPFSVIGVRGIPVATCGGAVRCAAIARFVDMNAVESGRLDLDP